MPTKSPPDLFQRGEYGEAGLGDGHGVEVDRFDEVSGFFQTCEVDGQRTSLVEGECLEDLREL